MKQPKVTLLPGTKTPTKFQYGDLVRAERYDHDGGGVVEGVIITAANNDPRCLHRGNVEIRLTGATGAYQGRYWVRASEVVRTAIDAAHPLVGFEPVAAVRWSCGCGADGLALGDESAREQFEAHRGRCAT